MLVGQKTALLITLCAEAEIVAKGSLFGDDGKPHPFLSVLEKFLAIFRQGQVALGLGLGSRMPREDNQTIAGIMAEYTRRSARPSVVRPIGNRAG